VRPLAIAAALLVVASGADSAATATPAREAVLGGRPATLAEFPWIAALVGRGSSPLNGQFCGGTVVASDAIVTAAHCVLGGTRIDVVVGRDRLRGTGGRRLRVARVTPHPSFSFERGGLDVAVLRVARPLEVPALPVATRAETGLLRAGAPVRVAGWGLVGQNPERRTDTLRQAALRIKDDSLCGSLYEPQFRPPIMVCAGSLRGGPPDSCRGDSGGPLVAGAGAGARLVGIVSFGGDRCAVRGRPSVYARVPAAASFIAAELARPRPPEPPPSATVPRLQVLRVRCAPACTIDGAASGKAGRVTIVAARIRRGRTDCVRPGGCTALDYRLPARRVGAGRYRLTAELPPGLLSIQLEALDSRRRVLARSAAVQVFVEPG